MMFSQGDTLTQIKLDKNKLKIVMKKEILVKKNVIHLVVNRTIFLFLMLCVLCLFSCEHKGTSKIFILPDGQSIFQKSVAEFNGSHDLEYFAYKGLSFPLQESHVLGKKAKAVLVIDEISGLYYDDGSDFESTYTKLKDSLVSSISIELNDFVNYHEISNYLNKSYKSQYSMDLNESVDTIIQSVMHSIVRHTFISKNILRNHQN